MSHLYLKYRKETPTFCVTLVKQIISLQILIKLAAEQQSQYNTLGAERIRLLFCLQRGNSHFSSSLDRQGLHVEVTRVPTKHTSIRCCSQENKQKQGFYLGLREKVDHTITSCLVIFFMLCICVSSCFVSRLCYFLLCGICLV